MCLESRRSFLHRAARVGLASTFARAAGGSSAAQAEVASAPASAPASGPSIGPIARATKSVVADLRSEKLVTGQLIHKELLIETIEQGVALATSSERPAEAWNKLFNADDIIGIKFNHVGERGLGTTNVFAAQLVKSLKRAGFAPERIMLIEAPNGLARKLKTKPQVFGWGGGPVQFASGTEELAAVLQEVTAIINVPFLKTHNIAGMTGCLKNLSHALIRRPVLYHANACTPYVGDIVALPQIWSKLRIHIINALRAVFDGGPEARVDGTWTHGGIVVSRDPVAADSVGLDIIDEKRLAAKLPLIGGGIARIPHVHAAAQRGLGADDQDYIDLYGPPQF